MQMMKVKNSEIEKEKLDENIYLLSEVRKYVYQDGRTNSQPIWVEYEPHSLEGSKIELKEVDIWTLYGNHICEGTGDFLFLDINENFHISVDWDGVISHAEVHDNIIAERHGESIHAYAVIIFNSIVYLCRDNGSYEEIETEPELTFEGWLRSFHNSHELEEEGII